MARTVGSAKRLGNDAAVRSLFETPVCEGGCLGLDEAKSSNPTNHPGHKDIRFSQYWPVRHKNPGLYSKLTP
jgi:hypothetical protein